MSDKIIKTVMIAFAVAISIVALLVGGGIGFQIGREHCEITPPDTVMIEHVDTCYVESPPEIVTKTETRYVPVTQYVTRTDTITDTIQAALLFEQHFAKIDDVADVWFSGFQPKIDSAVVYKKHTTEIVNHYIKEPSPKNIVGVSAGITDASIMYLRRIGPVWLGASAGYTYDGNATARGTIAFQF